MHKDAAVNATLLGEDVVSKATPDLRQRLAAVKALGPHGYGLHTPVIRSLVRIEDIDRLGLFGDLELHLEIGEVLFPRAVPVDADRRGGEVRQWCGGTGEYLGYLVWLWVLTLFALVSVSRGPTAAHCVVLHRSETQFRSQTRVHLLVPALSSLMETIDALHSTESMCSRNFDVETGRWMEIDSLFEGTV